MLLVKCCPAAGRTCQAFTLTYTLGADERWRREWVRAAASRDYSYIFHSSATFFALCLHKNLSRPQLLLLCLSHADFALLSFLVCTHTHTHTQFVHNAYCLQLCLKERKRGRAKAWFYVAATRARTNTYAYTRPHASTPTHTHTQYLHFSLDCCAPFFPATFPSPCLVFNNFSLSICVIIWQTNKIEVKKKL